MREAAWRATAARMHSGEPNAEKDRCSHRIDRDRAWCRRVQYRRRRGQGCQSDGRRGRKGREGIEAVLTTRRDFMQPFRVHAGIVAPLDRANVDTDAIIPKQFLKSIKRSG